MAKAAKEAASVELSERRANKFLSDILEHDQNILTARGKYGNAARREREAQTVLMEGMTAFGISQKVSKLNVNIKRAELKIAGWLAELDAEHRKQLTKLAKAQGDKRQLSFLNDLPPMPKPPKAEKPKKDAPVQTDIEDVHEGAALN